MFGIRPSISLIDSATIPARMTSGADNPELASSENSPQEADALAYAKASELTTSVEDMRRVQHFQRADRWFNRFVRLASALHEGFWLGRLSAEDLNAITSHHYQQSHEYSSPEHNQRGLFDWEAAVVDRYFSPGSRILVAAAGGGREVLALRRVGFQAEGFECSPALVQASDALFDRLGEHRSVFLCAADEVPPGPAIYTGIVVGWSAYTHIPTRPRRIAFLQGLRQRALPGSPILVSFFSREKAARYENLVYRTACISRFLFRGRKEQSELGDHLSWCYSHSFVREEIETELTAAGFRPVFFSEVGEGHAVGVAK
jgi:hypothetical protein